MAPQREDPAQRGSAGGASISATALGAKCADNHNSAASSRPQEIYRPRQHARLMRLLAGGARLRVRGESGPVIVVAIAGGAP